MDYHSIINSAWPIFWVTTAYSYLVCAFIGTITGVKTKGDKEKINKKLEQFIISPFYVSTFFCLLSSMYLWKGISLHLSFAQMLCVGGAVFLGHTAIEILESTFIWKNPLRILEDKDALRLSGIYLLILLQTAIIATYIA